MSWNNPVETEFKTGIVRTNKLYCTGCQKKLLKGEEAIFVLDDKDRFMAAYHDGCHDEVTIDSITDSLHPHNIEDGMTG